MGSTKSLSRVLSFPPFELDPSTGELWRDGERVLLQEQPFQLLRLLLERPGQVRDRKELRQTLWPDRPFVDSDHGINVAISKLRETLGDSAEAPRFIETLPRHGYRFVAPVAVNEQKERKARGTKFWRRGVALGFLVLFGAALLLTADRLVKKPAPAASSGEIRALAVLPFANLSGDVERQYLADGLTMSIISRLGTIGALRVISWQSVVQFKDSRRQLPEIAYLLDVDALVLGGVMQEGERMRIEVQLVATDPERLVWVESYDLTGAELLTVQREVARTIAAEVKQVVRADEETRLLGDQIVAAPAYDAYLEGLYHWARFSESDLLRAVEHFERSIALAPEFAAAYSALADSWLMMGWYGYRAPLEVFPMAEAAARRALELAPDSAEAHTSMAGVLSCYRRRIEPAIGHHRRAIQLNPSYSRARNWYSWDLAAEGRHEEALQQIRVAQRVDPLSVVIHTVAGVRLYDVGRYAEAVRQLEFVLEMNPEMLPALLFLGQAQRQAGDLDDAIATFDRAVAISNGGPTYEAALVSVLAVSGRRQEAEARLSGLIDRSEREYVSAYQVAAALVALERFDEAFQWLERAFEEGSPMIARAAIDPQLDPGRSDPRFAEILERVRTPFDG